MKELEKLVYQALGEASMCWSQVPKGIFQSNKAVEIGKKLINAIQALSQSEWISVEDRLPEIGLNEEFEHASEMILLSDGEFTYYGQYESSEEFGSYFIDANGDDFENDGVEITHWMPLPQPPQTK